MNFTFDVDLFSDLYKDCFGFRPRNHSFYKYVETDPVIAQELWDNLLRELDREQKRAEEMKEIHSLRFENHIQEVINLGAGDRKTALKWIIESYENEDASYICWDMALPYEYEKEIESILKGE